MFESTDFGQLLNEIFGDDQVLDFGLWLSLRETSFVPTEKTYKLTHKSRLGGKKVGKQLLPEIEVFLRMIVR